MITIRFKFERTEKLRFISHLDQQRLFQRAFRRAGVPLAYSSGFNPHPRLSFALAMSVGMVSDAEYGDIVLDKPMDLKDFVKNVNAALPEGIQLKEAYQIPSKAPSLTTSLKNSMYRIQVKTNGSADLKAISEACDALLLKPEIIIEKRNKKGKMVPKNIRPFIEEIQVLEMLGDKAVIEMCLKYIDQQSVKPEIVLGCIGGDTPCLLPDATMRLRRTALILN